jgi:hypothetical protein
LLFNLQSPASASFGEVYKVRPISALLNQNLFTMGDIGLPVAMTLSKGHTQKELGSFETMHHILRTLEFPASRT